MELFNKYNNADFIYLTNYINRCVNDRENALTEDEIKSDLLGKGEETFAEFIDFLLNRYGDEQSLEDYDANLLYKDKESGKMYPKIENYVAVRPSTAEKAWLYRILEDPKWPLFLSKELHDKLLQLLGDRPIAPLDGDFIEIRPYSSNTINIDEEYINTFKVIVKSIQEHTYMKVTNKAYSGITYIDDIIYPYKLEYDLRFQSFSLFAFSKSSRRAIKMNLRNLSKAKQDEKADNYKELNEKIESFRIERRNPEPLCLEVTNDKSGYDRCSFLFSGFDKECYEKDENTLVMSICFQNTRQQEDEIIRNLLFLGAAVKILSPQYLVDRYVEAVTKAYENYA